MARARTLMTASDLWQLPQDGQRYALIAGEVWRLPVRDLFA